jgi:hypothetical protein
MNSPGDSIDRTSDAVLTNHRLIRNGSLWACVHCPVSWPFGRPIPRDAGPCVPRRWGDRL